MKISTKLVVSVAAFSLTGAILGKRAYNHGYERGFQDGAYEGRTTGFNEGYGQGQAQSRTRIAEDLADLGVENPRQPTPGNPDVFISIPNSGVQIPIFTSVNQTLYFKEREFKTREEKERNWRRTMGNFII